MRQHPPIGLQRLRRRRHPDYRLPREEWSAVSNGAQALAIVAPPAGHSVQPPTAGIGFWNNKNGQALINAFNGGTATQLADSLAATMPNTFGAHAGNNDVAGDSNAAIAALFQQDFVLKGVKLDAQVLATTLLVTLSSGCRIRSRGLHSACGSRFGNHCNSP